MKLWQGAAVLIALVVGAVGVTAQRPASVPLTQLFEPVTLTVDTPMAAPSWALAERTLLELNAEGARQYRRQYLTDRGHLRTPERWGVSDGPDDAMENIRQWPLAHALGGPESLISDWEFAWEGHLDQFGRARIPELELARDGIFQKEFITSFDWEHTSEGLSGFYFYGLSRPTDLRHRSRTQRFAGLYLNEDPDAQNYDPKLRIIRSLFNGSKGPKLTPATADDWDGVAHEGVSQARRTRFLASSNIRGDHPLNLNAANLVLHAYLLTQQAKYRDWVLDYVGAWRERPEKNGGNIPSNIGLDGRVGGEWGGKWYGGVFGWNSPDEGNRNYVFRGPPEAFGAALLLTGDHGFTNVLRRQIDNLFAAKKEEGGKVLLPRRFGDQGWYDYHEMVGGPSGTLGNLSLVATDIYTWSLEDRDLQRLPKTGWIGYLTGVEPDYPLEALQQDLAAIQRASQRLQRDARGESPRRGGAMSGTGANPVAVTALINLTMGGNDPGGSSHGPLPLHTQVRHFDPELRRAGLPPDVGALVQRIEPDSVTLTLVNVSPFHARSVIVQTGAYAEHEATNVSVNGKSTKVDAPFFQVQLAPGAGTTVTIGMRRYAHQPTLAFPWDRAWMASKDTAPAPPARTPAKQ